MKLQRMLPNGKWYDEKTERVDDFINKAVEADKVLAPNLGRQPRTADEIRADLDSGDTVRYSTEDWYTKFRDADALAPKPTPRRSSYERILDCGHVVYNKSEVMSASNGTSCHRCYDRMSD